MIQGITNFAYAATSLAPKMRINSLNTMLTKASSIALPAILTIGADSLKKAAAFGFSCIACVICMAAPNPGCVIPCATCFVTIPIPGASPVNNSSPISAFLSAANNTIKG